MRVRRGLLLALLMTCVHICVHSQKPKLLTTEEGLSNTLVNQLFQDSRGYVWIATEDGLNRYDGQDLKVYHSKDNRSAKTGGGTLAGNYVRKVYEDSRGRLWVCTIRGLQIYNRERDVFEIVPIISRGIKTEAFVTDIVEDRRGMIWVSTSGHGVLKYVDGEAVDTHLKNDSTADYVSSMTCDEKGNLWLVMSSYNTVYKYNVEERTTERIKVDTERVQAENAYVTEIDGEIYLSANTDGLFKYDWEENLFRREEPVSKQFVSSIATNGKELYLGTDGDGLYVYNKEGSKKRKVDIFLPQINFHKTKIHSILFDRDGNMWLGVFQKGVVIIPKMTSIFKSYGYRPNSSRNIGSASVTAVMKDDDGLWIGTDGDGLYVVTKGGVTEHIEENMVKTVMGIAKGDNDEKLMIAGYDDGLKEYDKRRHKLTDLNPILKESSDAYSGRVVCVVKNPMGGYVVGTYGSGIYCLKDGKAKAYVSTSETEQRKNEPVNNWVNSMESDSYRVWIGTYKGLSCYDAARESFIDIDTVLLKAVGKKVVFDIALDEESCLWLATSEGVIKYNELTHEVRIMDRDNGLAADIAVGVVADKLGCVWISTYEGLSRYNQRLDHFNNYYSYDGLQGNQFSRAAVARDNKGRLYFGGTNGVTSLKPDNICPDSIEMRVEVTHFCINGHEMTMDDKSNGHQVMDKAVIDADKFVVSSAEKSFTIELSSFNFVNSALVRYEYNLEGYDSEWRKTSIGGSEIRFTNLEPGDYKLHMRSMLGGRVSNTKTIEIEIIPLWWQTRWAIGLFVLLGIMAIVLLGLSIRQRIFIKKEILRQEYARNVEEAKFQMFFNVSHEIRTPLTLIINPVKDLVAKVGNDKDLELKYDTIYRNSMRILHLINQLLDLRKIDEGHMKLTFMVTDIKEMVKETMYSFEYVARKKNISMELDNLMDDAKVAVDRSHFDKVLFNLYSNALKYTPDGGKVRTTLSEDGENIVIEVADTGHGIEPDKLEAIFDRFYQIDDSITSSSLGTGIGLHFSRSIVTLHNGTIKADNRKDGKSGAVFRVVVPRHHDNELTDEEVQKRENEEGNAMPAVSYTRRIFDSEKRRATTNKRVLVVDDEPEVSAYLVDELSKRYKVSSCSNGKEAYDLLLKEKFDAVVSDVIMPELDGMSLCKKVKSNININHIPVILLTAKQTAEDRNKGLVTGADAYIVKPFDMETLDNTLWSIIENRDRVMSKIGESKTGSESTTKKVTLKSADEALIEKVKAYIDANISDSSLNVERLADHVGMSRVHMHRKLKELTGQSARDFIKNIRLKEAGILLCEKKLNISDVAYALGFTNLSHFSTSFKDFYGVSPKEYMNEKLENPQDQNKK